jgi:prevent-host-death family protein
MKLIDNKVSAFDAKTHLSQLLQEVEKGRVITITRRGKSVARLVPAKDDTSATTEAILAEFASLREKIRGPVDIGELITEGRKH